MNFREKVEWDFLRVSLPSVPYDRVELGGRGGSDMASILGNPYFTVPPRTANHDVVLKRRSEMLFTSITTTPYTKAFPQSVLGVLWPVPPAFSVRSPRLGTPDTRECRVSRGVLLHTPYSSTLTVMTIDHPSTSHRGRSMEYSRIHRSIP